jgi:hypothetical protein
MAIQHPPTHDVLANRRAMDAVLKIKHHGEQMMNAFAELEEARRELKKFGIEFNPAFEPIINAAYRVHRNEPLWDR